MIIDISQWQEPSKINYDELAKYVQWVIIRTQYGSKVIDRHYQTHHREFQKRGIPTAAYAFVRGVSVSDMTQEARDFYTRTKEFNPTFWFLDVEEQTMSNMRAGISAYVQQLRDLGAKKIGIYIANHLYKPFNLNLDEVDAVWIPHYGEDNGQITSKPDYPCDIHQYTQKGRLPGYNGYLDLNRVISNKPLSYFTGKETEGGNIKMGSIFKDVPDNHWAINDIKWAKETGLIKGEGDGNFGLGKPVTREEIAVILHRFFDMLKK